MQVICDSAAKCCSRAPVPAKLWRKPGNKPRKVFLTFCRCRLIIAADGFPSHIPTVDLPESPALPSSHIVSSAHAAAGAECSLLSPHPFPAPSSSPPFCTCVPSWDPPGSGSVLSARGGSASAVGWDGFHPHGISLPFPSFEAPQQALSSCPALLGAPVLTRAWQRACTAAGKAAGVWRGEWCFLGKMQLCWEGFVMVRAHKECWKWGRKKHCLTPRRSFSSLPKMTESPLATVSSHFTPVFSAPFFPCLFLPSLMRLMGYCIDYQSGGRMEIQPPSPAV